MRVIHGVFAPCVYKEHKFVDGGLLDNVPADELLQMGENKILAAKFPPGKHEKIQSVYDIAFKSIDIMMDERDKKTIDTQCFVLDIALVDAKVFDIRKIRYCYQVGYAIAKDNMHAIKQYIEE